jgi:hypothetical protein
LIDVASELTNSTPFMFRSISAVGHQPAGGVMPIGDRVTFAQARVAILLFKGYTAAETAATLDVSIATVRSHLRGLHPYAERSSNQRLINWCWHHLRSDIRTALASDPRWVREADDLAKIV